MSPDAADVTVPSPLWGLFSLFCTKRYEFPILYEIVRHNGGRRVPGKYKGLSKIEFYCLPPITVRSNPRVLPISRLAGPLYMTTAGTSGSVSDRRTPLFLDCVEDALLQLIDRQSSTGIRRLSNEKTDRFAADFPLSLASVRCILVSSKGRM
jgi:hypothetical protein